MPAEGVVEGIVVVRGIVAEGTAVGDIAEAGTVVAEMRIVVVVERSLL